MLGLPKHVFIKISKCLLHNDNRNLLAAAVEQIGVEKHQNDIFMKGMKYTKKSCPEKRLIRCVAAGNMERKDVLDLTEKDAEYMGSK